MEFWIFLAVAISLLLGYPYLCSAVKRLALAIKLRYACKKHNYRLYTRNLFWLFAGRGGKSYDLCIETSTEILAIKLFGVPRRLSILIFEEGGTYRIRYFIPFLSYSTHYGCYPIDGKQKKCNAELLEIPKQLSVSSKPITKILLVSPLCREITEVHRGGKSILGAGDTVNGFQVESLPHLLKKLNFEAPAPLFIGLQTEQE